MNSLRTCADLRALGFQGFHTVADLIEDQSAIPEGPGVYAVLWTASEIPDFIEAGTGGWFKGRDPNVARQTLGANWVPTSAVVYLGKAAGGLSGRRGLRKRLSEFLLFGQGRPIAHRGGRYIWQIRQSAELVFCWVEVPDGCEAVESRLLAEFVAQHGRLPFANLRH